MANGSAGFGLEAYAGLVEVALVDERVASRWRGEGAKLQPARRKSPRQQEKRPPATGTRSRARRSRQRRDHGVRREERAGDAEPKSIRGEAGVAGGEVGFVGKCGREAIPCVFSCADLGAGVFL
jgi:hypothetical protein